MPTKTTDFNYIGTIELPIDCISECYHSGACDADIDHWIHQRVVMIELSRIDPKKLRLELKEYGAWEEEELENHQENLKRILWLACANIQEETNTD